MKTCVPARELARVRTRWVDCAFLQALGALSLSECHFSQFPRDAERPRARMRARATRVAIGRSGARIATRVERRLSNILSTSFNIFVVRHGIGANASAHHENDTPVAWVVVMIDDAARREPTERASDGRRMHGRVVKM